MPDLPVVTVTQAQYDRLINTIEGTTQTEKLAKYREIVRNALKNYVIDIKSREVIEIKQQEATEALDAIRNDPDNL